MKIDLVNYSEKSFALFGDTKEIKDYLKEMGGKFNPYLNFNGGKKAGWIFSNNAKSKIKLFLKGYSSVNDSNSITVQNTPIIEPEIIVQPEVKEIVKVAANVIKPQIKEVKPSVKKFNWQNYFKLNMKKCKLPTLECLYFDTVNKHIVQTNLINFVIVPFWEGLQVNESCCIDFQDLKSIKVLESIEVINKDIVLINNLVKVNNYDCEEFPNLPKLDTMETIKINDFEKIKKGLYACGKDGLRPSMTGIYFHENRIASTNGHLLYTTNLDSSLKVSSYILNSEGCGFINSDCEINFGGEWSEIIFDSYKVICRVIDDRFPDYQNAIPLDNPVKFNFDKKDLIEVVKKVLPFTNKQTSRLIFDVKDNVCSISADDKLTLLVDCNSGIEIKFGINGKFLSEMLNNLQSSTVNFECSTVSRPFLIKDNNTTHLVMPMILDI